MVATAAARETRETCWVGVRTVQRASDVRLRAFIMAGSVYSRGEDGGMGNLLYLWALQKVDVETLTAVAFDKYRLPYTCSI